MFESNKQPILTLQIARAVGSISSCTICHQGVIDAFGEITDKTKHINGKVNVFGMEYPMY